MQRPGFCCVEELHLSPEMREGSRTKRGGDVSAPMENASSRCSTRGLRSDLPRSTKLRRQVSIAGHQSELMVSSQNVLRKMRASHGTRSEADCLLINAGRANHVCCRRLVSLRGLKLSRLKGTKALMLGVVVVSERLNVSSRIMKISASMLPSRKSSCFPYVGFVTG
jgi:hypothetical protein